MKTRGSEMVGYNVQAAVDAKHLLIVTHAVTNDGVDRDQLSSMAKQAREAMAQKDGNCGPINFDPFVVADGIQITDDPVLKARSAAYAVSFGKRMSGQ